MRDPVIVSYARTPIAKANRGAFNDTPVPVLGAAALRAATARAGLAEAEIEDLTMGCALTQGTGGINAARHVVMAAGLPDGVAAKLGVVSMCVGFGQGAAGLFEIY